jgi:CheY-like chemotaxis protein/two-component sensor histidine kinase
MKEDARRKDEFIATLSHELRTPLTAILGWTSMLKLGLDPQTQKSALETIERSGRMQAELIDDILDVSRITAGKMRIEPQKVNLAEVCAAAVEGVRLAASAKELDLELDMRSEDDPLILGDPNRLQQVVWNLLTNAIKFTPAGGRVTVRVETSGREVIVAVTDTGIGIDAAFLPHVFELFRQAELSATRMHGGLGLGLSIVRHLVEAHGGRITVESAGSGHGATFTVVFPRLGAVAAASAPMSTARLHAGEMPAPAANLDGIDVMIIDDHPSVRDYFTAALQHSGARIRTAESVRDAVAQISVKPPQVVVCDLAMPDEDGFTFIAWLRAQNFPRVPVIAITALGRPDDRQRALRAGFDDFLSKPVSPEDLSGAVARNVGV